MTGSTSELRDDRFQIHKGEALAFLAGLPDNSVDALITDPPYSSGGMVRGDRTSTDTKSKYSGGYGKQPDHAEFSGDNRDQRGYGYWLALWLAECLRLTKPGGLCLLFTDWRQLPTTTDALQAGGWVWRGVVPWYKPVTRPMPGGFAGSCEYVVWGSCGPLERDYANGSYLPGFYQANAPRERDHLTQKPLEVMRKLVQVVPKGGVVLDPFMGSGTTGVAALLEGRKFIGSELTEHYYDVARKRHGDSGAGLQGRRRADGLGRRGRRGMTGRGATPHRDFCGVHEGEACTCGPVKRPAPTRRSSVNGGVVPRRVSSCGDMERDADGDDLTCDLPTGHEGSHSCVVVREQRMSWLAAPVRTQP